VSRMARIQTTAVPLPNEILGLNQFQLVKGRFDFCFGDWVRGLREGKKPFFSGCATGVSAGPGMWYECLLPRHSGCTWDRYCHCLAGLCLKGKMGVGRRQDRGTIFRKLRQGIVSALCRPCILRLAS
jgi:hypothetical protein